MTLLEKTLLLIYNQPEKIFNASTCGDNCAKWILKIADKVSLNEEAGDEKNQNKKPEISSGFTAKMIFEWKNIRKLTKLKGKL